MTVLLPMRAFLDKLEDGLRVTQSPFRPSDEDRLWSSMVRMARVGLVVFESGVTSAKLRECVEHCGVHLNPDEQRMLTGIADVLLGMGR